MKKWTALANQADRSFELLNGATDVEPYDLSKVTKFRQSNAFLGLVGAFAGFAFKFNKYVIAPELKLHVTPERGDDQRLSRCRVGRGKSTSAQYYQVLVTSEEGKGFRIENKDSDDLIYGVSEYSVRQEEGPLRLISNGNLLTTHLVAEIHLTWLVSIF